MPFNLTRSLLVILIPGAVALAPWVLISVHAWPFLANHYQEYPFFVNGLLFGFVVILGTFFETLGAKFEETWDEKRNEKYQVMENWYKYLSRSIYPEPVANRYMGRLVTRMYFGLSMVSATLVFALGCVALALTFENMWILVGSVVVVVVGVALSVFFEWEANETHKELCKVRKQLNFRLDATKTS